jgi:hypothetical protein
MRVPFSVQTPFYRVRFSVSRTEFSPLSRAESPINKGLLKVPYLLPLYISIDDSMVTKAFGFVAGFLTGLEFGFVVGTVLG